MSYYNRSSSKSADSAPVGAAALRGSGVPVGPPPAAEPPPVRRDPNPRPAGPAPAPFESPSSVAHVSVDRQVQTLQTAAKNGTPFCEECAKAAAANEAKAGR